MTQGSQDYIPESVSVEVFSRSHDTCGNPTARYLLQWSNGKTGAAYQGGATLEEGESGGLPVCRTPGCGWSCADIPESYGFGDLSPAALERIKTDCAAFEKQNRKAIANLESFDLEQVGRDFWFTRCGHGVGFWDRKGATVKERNALAKLDKVARDAGEVWAYRGDDSRVYLA